MIEENDNDMPLPEFKDYNITEDEALKKTYEFLDLMRHRLVESLSTTSGLS